VTPGLTWVGRAWFQRLKLKCDEALTNFAFNFNLRRYCWAYATFEEDCVARGVTPDHGVAAEIGRCRLTVSKPVLKAPMVSALETIII